MVVIDKPRTIEVEGDVVLMRMLKLSVYLSNATTGRPFISMLELRMFIGLLLQLVISYSLSYLFPQSSFAALLEIMVFPRSIYPK